MPIPTTGVLDDFTRPDENPLRWGGRWAKLSTSMFDMFTNANTCSAISTEGAAYWVPQSFTNFEVFATCNTFSGGQSLYLFGRLNDVGTATFDGYSGYVSAASARIVRWDNGSNTVLATFASTFNNGETFLFRGIGNILQVYFFRSGAWDLAVQTTDNTYSSGRIGLGATASTIVLDNFGGGAFTERNITPPVSGFGAC